MRAWKVYRNALQRSPRITNAAMSATLFGLGDALAQKISMMKDKENTIITTKYVKQENQDEKVTKFDIRRNLRSAVYGGIIFAPIGDKWYHILQSYVYLKKFPINHFINVAYRVGVDQLLFAPFGLALYFSSMSVLEHNPLQFHTDTWASTLQTNWKIWPAVQLINFWFVPIEHRLLLVNTVAVGWNTYLSLQNSQKR